MIEKMNGNQIDYYLHETAIVVVMLAVFALLGWGLGRFLTRRSRMEFRRLEEERRDLMEPDRTEPTP